MRRDAPLSQDAEPRFYVYSLEMDGRRQTGLVAAASVDEYDAGGIKKHELTRKDKEDDRTRHILTLRSQTGPVFLLHRDSADVETLVRKTMAETPLFDFTVGPVRHTGWRVPESATPAVVAAFRDVPCLYIADGHHRAASASRVRDRCRAENPSHTGNEEYNRFLAVIFPASHLRILPYNRLVKDLNGLTPEEFLRRVGERFEVSCTGDPAPKTPRSVHLYLPGQWYCLRWTGDVTDLSPVEALDVSLLQNHVLGPILDITDPRVNPRIDFMGGVRGTGVLQSRVDAGEAAVAFSMSPTTVEQLMAIADAGAIMPPKSTWFEPKLCDGLFVHDI